RTIIKKKGVSGGHATRFPMHLSGGGVLIIPLLRSFLLSTFVGDTAPAGVVAFGSAAAPAGAVSIVDVVMLAGAASAELIPP
ncbi:hypothetical protein, partial [Bacilliculturomica massiliensis]|uniref:hypothetical protein n=1 Tax=Bacilliculturomica massiliensis TaxID=1917867 RepID=UPI001A9119AB